MRSMFMMVWWASIYQLSIGDAQVGSDIQLSIYHQD